MIVDASAMNSDRQNRAADQQQNEEQGKQHGASEDLRFAPPAFSKLANKTGRSRFVNNFLRPVRSRCPAHHFAAFNQSTAARCFAHACPSSTAHTIASF